jgi:hypothetical protein
MTSATRRRLGALMLATLFPAAANGQRTPSTPAPALSFDEMALRVNVGAMVIVADTSGRRFSGRLTALSNETLSMLTAAAQ